MKDIVDYMLNVYESACEKEMHDGNLGGTKWEWKTSHGKT